MPAKKMLEEFQGFSEAGGLGFRGFRGLGFRGLGI